MDFLHPDELRAALPLSIGRQGCSDEELQEIRSAVMFIFVCLCVGNCEYFMTFSEAVVKYSVKTCHPHFYNQVRGSRWLSIRGQFLETFFSATHSCLPKHYSVLHFQLYHGADEYGVAGSWLSDALNTNIHTFEVGKVLPWVTISKDNQVAPSFIIIEHSVLGHIRKLFDWGEQVGASSQSASFHIFIGPESDHWERLSLTD